MQFSIPVDGTSELQSSWLLVPRYDPWPTKPLQQLSLMQIDDRSGQLNLLMTGRSGRPLMTGRPAKPVRRNSETAQLQA